MLLVMIGKVLIGFLCTATLCGVLVFVVVLSSLTSDAPKALVAYPPASLQLSTDTWGIFDPESGVVLAGSNSEMVRPIASVTKLFTAHAVLESGGLDESVEITYRDVATEGRAGKLSPGEHLTRRELLFPLLIESSNDAGEALRRSIGESFTESLTSLQQTLALTETHIVDASGLDHTNTSTVHDLARFASYLRRHEPYVLDITQLDTYVGEEDGWVNNNPLEGISGFRGGKHGFTPEAGRTFVGFFHSERLGTDVGIVLLGSEDLTKDVEDILASISISNS